MDGWLAILRPFQFSISVRSGRSWWLADDNERLCAMEPRLGWETSPLAGFELRTARSVGQCLTHWAIGAPIWEGEKYMIIPMHVWLPNIKFWVVSILRHALYRSRVVLFYNTPYIEALADDNERLCAMEPRSGWETSPLVGFKLGTARSVDQHLTHWAIGTPIWEGVKYMIIPMHVWLPSIKFWVVSVIRHAFYRSWVVLFYDTPYIEAG